MLLTGLDVLVLERRHVIGGAAVTEEIVPGFKFSRASYLADVCVIGSGITGIGAVWNLVKGFRERPRVRRENLTVVVFEAREFCE